LAHTAAQLHDSDFVDDRLEFFFLLGFHILESIKLSGL